MPVLTPEAYRGVLDAASAEGWALPAINVTSSQTVHGVLQGLEAARSDGIVQVTSGAAAYLGGDRPGGALRGAAALAAFVHEVAAGYDASVALHTDHTSAAEADGFIGGLLERSAARRDRGELPLFTSHMFDGSTLPLEENLMLSAAWLERCRALDVVLELEVGAVGGEEDGLEGGALGSERLYTTPADLLRVDEVLGAGGYLLAATFGNVHGVYAAGNVVLRPEILEEGQRALAARRPGSRFRYVFHGASGSDPADIRAAVAAGVVKVNLDTSMQFAFSGGVRRHVDEHGAAMADLRGGPASKRAFDPRAWGRAAQQAMAEDVARACVLLGSAGRARNTATG